MPDLLGYYLKNRHSASVKLRLGFACALFVVGFSPTDKASLCVGSITILHKKRGLAKSQPPFLWRRGWDVLSLSSKQYKLSHGNVGSKTIRGKWRRGWDVLSLSSKQYKLAHGNRGFKKNGKNGGEGGI